MNMKPVKKFQLGIRRIIRIVKSYRADRLTDMLMSIQDKNRKERNNNEIKKKVIVLRKASMRPNSNMSPEQRQEQKISQLTNKIDKLTSLIEEQSKAIKDLKSYIRQNDEFVSSKSGFKKKSSK